MVREWVGGRVQLPGYVMEGEPFRPEMILWLELPDGLVVGATLVDPGSPPVSASKVLLEAMKRPMAGAPRRPRRVRVADEALARELRAAVRDVEVVVGATPELRGVVDLMMKHAPLDDAAESYLEDGRVPAEAVKRLFCAAEALWRVAPWKVVHDAQVVRADLPRFGVRGACLSIIGNLGESHGLLLFPSLDGFDAFLHASDRRRGALDLGTTVLSLEFERGAELPASMRREVATRGWPVAAPEAYPRVTHRDRDGLPRPIAEIDVRVMTRVAEAFVPFFIEHEELFASEQPPSVSRSYRDADGIEVRLTAPYDSLGSFDAPEPRRTTPKLSRNAPCPCGSGNKYKKCCLPKEVAAVPSGPAQVHREDERLVFAMMSFAEERFGAAWRRSWRDFVDADGAMQLHRPWSVYGFRVEGRPVVDWYLDERRARLRPDERAWLEAQQHAWMGIWEVLTVDPGRSVTVRDLLSDERRTVHEASGSKTLRPRDTILGRIVDLDGVSVFVGIHPRPLMPRHADDVVRKVRRKLRVKASVSVEKLRDEPLGRHLIKSWERAVAEMDAQALAVPMLQNTDGDPLLMTSDHFRFDRGNRAEIERALSRMDGVQSPEADDREHAFTFLRVGNAMHKDWENTVVGHAVLGNVDLRLETNSVRRADELRRRIEARVGDLVRHRAREHSDPLAPGNRPAPGAPLPESDIPPELQDQLLIEYKQQHYAAWLDEAIPALAGKTPRQAARTKTGRAKLDLLLREIENHEAALREGARFDFTRLRAELQLEP